MGARRYVGIGLPDQARSEWPGPSLRYQHGAGHLHRLGARATAEFLSEIARVQGIERDVLDRLDRWRCLSAEACREAGGDRSPSVLAEVPR